MPLFKIQHRRDTAASWQAVNPVLLEGEMGLVTPDAGTGEALLFKMGDGQTAWNALPFASGPPGPSGGPGEKGDNGPAGVPGLQGEKGDRGDKGDAGDLPPLSDSVTSPDSGVAASSMAVKTAYDRAEATLGAAASANTAAGAAGAAADAANTAAGTAQARADAAYAKALAVLANPLPYGIVCMWAGYISTIPAGWALCNGQNGTPDLRDRFIVGAGYNYSTGLVGGTISHTHVVGVDAATLSEWQMPAHAHAYAAPNAPISVLSGGVDPSSFVVGRTTVTSSATGGSGTHLHTAWSDARDHRPPFYAIAFIMKM